MARQPLHDHPQKGRTFPGPDLLNRFESDVVNFLDILSLDLLPVSRLKHSQRERIDFPRRAADAVSVVLNNEKDRQFLFFCETNRFEEITLPRGGVTDGGDHQILLFVELDSPSNAAGREELRTSGRGHAPNMQAGMAIVRRHLPAAASGIALGKIFQGKLLRGHASSKNKAAVAIIRHDVIVWLHLDGNGGERFVSHPGDMEVAFALTIQILLAQIRMPAFQHGGEKPQFFFFAQRWHTRSILQLHLRIDNHADLVRMDDVDECGHIQFETEQGSNRTIS